MLVSQPCTSTSQNITDPCCFYALEMTPYTSGVRFCCHPSWEFQIYSSGPSLTGTFSREPSLIPADHISFSSSGFLNISLLL